MPDTNQYLFPTKDLLHILLKHGNIHEGNWILIATFGFAALNTGDSATGEDASPSAMTRLQQVGIQRVPDPLPFSIDAAVVNPKKK
jgi:hypothetical protein